MVILSPAIAVPPEPVLVMISWPAYRLTSPLVFARSAKRMVPVSVRRCTPLPAVASIVLAFSCIIVIGFEIIPIDPEAFSVKLPKIRSALALVTTILPPVAVRFTLLPAALILPLICIPAAEVTFKLPVSEPINFTLTRLSALTSWK